MEKQIWKPGNMLYPVPAVLVSTADPEGHDNLITIAWAGTVCSEPPALSISVRKERFSHEMIRRSGEFVVNLTTEHLARAVDYCGVKSGRDVDKWKECNLTRGKSTTVRAPYIKESPVNIECRVKQVLELGSHDLFLAEVTAVLVDEELIDADGKLDLAASKPLVYSHGEYYGLGSQLGTFGCSVRKKAKNMKKDMKRDSKKR